MARRGGSTLTPEEEADEEEEHQPKRQRAEQLPLGIRRQGPLFDRTRFVDEQRKKDEREERELLEKVEQEDLDSPDIHQDYEIQDGDEYDRHLEGISSVNALKEFIAQAKEEVEEELEVASKPFSEERMDKLMVFTKEAITGYGEEPGYAELKKRVRELIEEDQRLAQAEMDRKKDAYLRSAGK
jgi:hypothetical protein